MPLLMAGPQCPVIPHTRISFTDQHESEMLRLQRGPLNLIKISPAVKPASLARNALLSPRSRRPVASVALAASSPFVRAVSPPVLNLRSSLREVTSPLGEVAKYPFGPRFPREMCHAAHQSSNFQITPAATPQPGCPGAGTQPPGSAAHKV